MEEVAGFKDSDKQQVDKQVHKHTVLGLDKGNLKQKYKEIEKKEKKNKTKPKQK